MKFVEYYLNTKEKEQIVAAIKDAELMTSGEIRVFFERSVKGESPEDRALRGFHKLDMHKTELRNGVLFYIAFKDRKYAVIGDRGIHEKVGQEFWDSISHVLREHFAREQFVEGLSKAIAEVGIQLKEYYPFHDDDINELPDDIYFDES